MILNSNCVFCKIASGKAHSKIIVQDEKAIAFLDAYPLSKGHTLVIPKLHFPKIEDLTEEYALALFHLLWRIVGPVQRAAGVKGTTIAIHNGREAGQEISHAHIHIIPRHVDDGAGPVHSMFLSRPEVTPTDMDQIAIKIKEELL
jgi:histidine triad (HIT) family protein